jgi:hypothetical protein
MGHVTEHPVLRLYESVLSEQRRNPQGVEAGQIIVLLQGRLKGAGLGPIQRMISGLLADGDLVEQAVDGKSFIKVSVRGRRSYRILRDRYNPRRDHPAEGLLKLVSILVTLGMGVLVYFTVGS